MDFNQAQQLAQGQKSLEEISVFSLFKYIIIFLVTIVIVILIIWWTTKIKPVSTEQNGNTSGLGKSGDTKSHNSGDNKDQKNENFGNTNQAQNSIYTLSNRPAAITPSGYVNPQNQAQVITIPAVPR